MSKVFEDRDLMKLPVCPMSGLDLTHYPLLASYHKFISGPATSSIFIIFTRVNILLINCSVYCIETKEARLL